MVTPPGRMHCLVKTDNAHIMRITVT